MMLWIIGGFLLNTFIGAWVCASMEEAVGGFRQWFDLGKREFGGFLFPIIFLHAWPVWVYLYWKYSRKDS